MNILDKIIEHKKEEIARCKIFRPLQLLKDQPCFSRETFSLKAGLQNSPGVIAEFKRKSPSKGFINQTALPAEVVPAYQDFGAKGISVLTDAEFFGGSAQDILDVRPQLQIPVLRKDFMTDEYQFYEARAMGADVVLLIAACLSPSQTAEFSELAHQLSLEVLLEIHSEEELRHLNADVDMVGINNRNLKNFEVNLQHSVDLKNLLPEGIPAVAESGIYSVEDFMFLREKGFNGFLMGEYFMRNPDPGAAFQKFMKEVMS